MHGVIASFGRASAPPRAAAAPSGASQSARTSPVRGGETALAEALARIRPASRPQHPPVVRLTSQARTAEPRSRDHYLASCCALFHTPCSAVASDVYGLLPLTSSSHPASTPLHSRCPGLFEAPLRWFRLRSRRSISTPAPAHSHRRSGPGTFRSCSRKCNAWRIRRGTSGKHVAWSAF